ncbi:MAG: hypothetical protein KAS98_12410, partial [Deltaproteobacteria bacterium]|nr:hypothetical protein [Deltaproteobacteria bacterium]
PNITFASESKKPTIHLDSWFLIKNHNIVTLLKEIFTSLYIVSLFCLRFVLASFQTIVFSPQQTT